MSASKNVPLGLRKILTACTSLYKGGAPQLGDVWLPVSFAPTWQTSKPVVSTIFFLAVLSPLV